MKLEKSDLDLQKLSVDDIQNLINELQVQRIELEAQNEELRRTQNDLEDSRNRYSNLYDFAPIGYFTFDKKGLIIEVNLTGAKILGVYKNDLIKKPFSLYVAFGSRDMFYLHLRNVFRTNVRQTCEIKLVDKNKNEFDVQLESLAVNDNNGEVCQCRTVNDDICQCRTAIIDITEHKLSEEKIHEQAELIDKAQDAIGVRDLEHRLVYWNKGAERLYGWKSEEVIGKVADSLLYEEEYPLLVQAKKNVIERGEWIGELHQITKDKKEITVESRWSLIHNSGGKPTSILIINTDITEKKKLGTQLLRAQRMESIGTLAGGIAHDLNNVLTPIMLSLQMLKEKYTDEQSQKLLTILEDNSQRGADLIKQVLSFSRGIEGERNLLQVKHIITEIIKVIKETFPRNIEIRNNISKDLFTILGDYTQLHQVIMNLCVNSRDAMPGGGVLNISAENFFIDDNYARMEPEAKVGPYVVITVSDTGMGIPSKIIDRIFEPFFTTKEFGKGTGLGLSTSLAIVKSHGGFINVYSEVGKGTTFKVFLSAIKADMQNVDEQKFTLPVGQGELVIVAEDEDSVREITVSALENYGYDVIEANDGAEAVSLFAQNKDNIKVVLMDLMMPVMDGETSIRVIRKIKPEVKIIAVSGLAEKEKLKHVADYTNAFLSKPYTAEKLLKLIHEVLS